MIPKTIKIIQNKKDNKYFVKLTCIYEYINLKLYNTVTTSNITTTNNGTKAVLLKNENKRQAVKNNITPKKNEKPTSVEYDRNFLSFKKPNDLKTNRPARTKSVEKIITTNIFKNAETIRNYYNFF